MRAKAAGTHGGVRAKPVCWGASIDAVLDILKELQLHPWADHFTVGILILAVLIDLGASLVPSRQWLRYSALMLIIVGTLSAAASRVTGGWEAERLWGQVSGPAREVLKSHAELGEYLLYTFAVLAFWRVLIQSFGFAARSRQVYLAVAVLGAAVLLYQAHQGEELVYQYGVRTELMAVAAPQVASPAPTPAPTEASPSPLAAEPTPAMTPSPTPSPSPAQTPSPTPEALSSPQPTPAETASPVAEIPSKAESSPGPKSTPAAKPTSTGPADV